MASPERPAAKRCESMHPRSSLPSQCERPAGHAGDHVAVSWSGNVKVYPSKWEDEPSAANERRVTLPPVDPAEDRGHDWVEPDRPAATELRVPMALVLVFDEREIRESYDGWCVDVAADGGTADQSWEEWRSEWVEESQRTLIGLADLGCRIEQGDRG